MEEAQFKADRVEEFLSHPVWKHFVATVEERVEAARSILEIGIDPVTSETLDVGGMKFFQGSLKEDRYLLWFLEDLKQEIEKEEGE